MKIAVIGSGISGLSAAWLLSKRYEVSLFEADARLGGHSNTVSVGGTPVDTGFIVYNEATYPNLTALFEHLGVATAPSNMSFAVSLDGGRLEYSGTGLSGLFAQPANLGRPRFWNMLLDLLRFYRQAPGDLPEMGDISLADYLDAKGFGQAFRRDHLYPMAAAIWSTPAADVGAYPAAAFVRFCDNHGLLKLADRPVWRTVLGGSREYVRRLAQSFPGRIHLSRGIQSVTRRNGSVEITDFDGGSHRFDQVVIATHADRALRMLADPSSDERALLGSFAYGRNEAVLHTDPLLMPRRKRVWSSWNYLAGNDDAGLSVTYWMNRLQPLADRRNLFVTLNPIVAPRAETVLHREVYEHPQFDLAAMQAQKRLWQLQGVRNTWFCGAYFGAGFHEDGLQSGLAVAEAVGGVRRPWSVTGESDRITILEPARSRELAVVR